MVAHVSTPPAHPAVAAPPRGVRSPDDVRGLFQALSAACRTQVQGRDDVINLVLTALFADGHVLLEDHPGSGKTTLAKALGRSLTRFGPTGGFPTYKRIQFTPDSLPSDITGAAVFEQAKAEFVFRPGPIFANVVLADEINRTSPKVQAALLEAMAEKHVTVDSRTYGLEEVFFVLATQNPLDLMGTYPLPRAQLDRFLFKIKMTHLAREHELEVLARRQQKPRSAAPVATPDMICQARAVIRDAVRVTAPIQEALVDIARATRADRRILQGVSTRTLVQAVPALQTLALVQGRDFVTPQDIKALAVPLLSHRLEPASGVKDIDAVVTELVKGVLEGVSQRTLHRAPEPPPAPLEAPGAEALRQAVPPPLPTQRSAAWKGFIAGLLG